MNYLVVPKNMKDGFRMVFAKGACVLSENFSIIEEIFVGRQFWQASQRKVVILGRVRSLQSHFQLKLILLDGVKVKGYKLG